MSRKGNSIDNGMMENFFGILKTEMFYGQEDKYKTLDELILAIDDYINYYNYDRIKVKLKGLSPVNYRLQSTNQKLFINCPTFGVQFKFRCDFIIFYFLKFKKTKSFFKKLKLILSKYNEYFLLGPPNFEEPKNNL